MFDALGDLDWSRARIFLAPASVLLDPFRMLGGARSLGGGPPGDLLGGASLSLFGLLGVALLRSLLRGVDACAESPFLGGAFCGLALVMKT